MLERLESIETAVMPALRFIVALVLGTLLTIMLLREPSLRTWGGVVMVWGLLIVLMVSVKPSTMRRRLQALKEASKSKGFTSRLTGFMIVVVGTCLILAAKNATFLEEVFAIVIMTYVWFCNVQLA